MNDLSDQIPTTPPPLTAETNSDPRRIHAQAIKTPQTDISVFNKLITIYSKSNLFSSYSLGLFHQLQFPNVVSWTSLISAQSNTTSSLHHFISMLRHPTFPNQRTLASLFKTCAALPSLSFGLALHSLAHKLALSVEPFSGSSLITFYSKFRSPKDARKVFDEIPHRDKVCFSAIIVGLAQNSWPFQALSIFSQMRACDIESTVHSISGALQAAAEHAALDKCRIIHAHSVITGLDHNVIVGTALIDGYGKSGAVMDSRQIFDDNFIEMNTVGWNALMAAYAQQGDKDSVLDLFHSMESEKELVPDEYSFLAIVSAHCNAGLVDETEKWLTRMKTEYGVEPRLEHYTCLIDAMGKAGRLKDAERIANTMPFMPDAAVWRAMLSSAASHRDGDTALSMANRLLEFDPQDDSAYVIVANALSIAGRWEEVAEVRKMMKNRRVNKEGGRSWIEVRGEVHVFLSGDRRHAMSEAIYTELKELMGKIEKLGYLPIRDEVALHKEVGEREKRESLWYHSEKLALAFGMVSGAAIPGKMLRIVKNLRTCRDCHEFFKYVSRVLDREITVRDVNRYHRFLDGMCTCSDIW